jgi:hypothetical protein
MKESTAGSEARTAGHRQQQQSRAVVSVGPAGAETTGARCRTAPNPQDLQPANCSRL